VTGREYMRAYSEALLAVRRWAVCDATGMMASALMAEIANIFFIVSS